MIIYNVTIKVDREIHDEWVHWMKTVHIPDVMNTGYFNDHRMMRILAEDESDGISYAIQYHARNMSDYFEYQEKEAPRLQKETNDRYKDRFVAFRTIMRVV